MKNVWAIIFAGYVLCACDEAANIKEYQEDLKDFDVSSNKAGDSGIQTIWVCHHPGTKHHNELCVEEEYPAGCYVSGDSHKFCWALDRKDCLGGYEGGYLEACELFKGQLTETDSRSH